MSLDTQFEKQKHRYLQKLSVTNTKAYNSLLKQLLESPHCESWKILDEVLKQIQKKDKYLYKDTLSNLDRITRDITSFPMLIYLYNIKITKKDCYIIMHWKYNYQEIGLNNGQIVLFSTWVTSQPSAKIVQQTLWMMASTIPSFMNKQLVQMTQIELNAVIEWVTFMETADPDKYIGACQLVKLAKESYLKVRDDYVQKQHLILKKLIEVAGQSAHSSANIFLFIYPFTLRQKDINYFCHVYSDFLTDLNEDNICNFFTAITKSAISKEIVCLINKMSQMLKNEDEYFKLRIIYQKFILPILARRAKACTKVEESVYETSSLFILGFLKHCDIGQEGIKCVLKGIGKIKNDEIKRKWIQLCSIICARYPDSKSLIVQSLKAQLDGAIQLNPTAYNQAIKNPEIVWQVTLRSGRKHKKYPKVPSSMKGIENNSNECYIISTVQGLHKTQIFEKILKTYKDSLKGKLPLLDEMRILFGEVSGKKKTQHIKVSYLKKRGPELFSESASQEDVQQYIIELFDSLERQMKKIPNMLKEFKDTFEIKLKNTIKCSKCKKNKEQEDTSYTYTIPHTQILSNQTEEVLPGYQCESCGEKECRIVRRLIPSSKILIVHINRFSHEKGMTKKELSTQTILRQFMGYELVGMICHIGKNVEHGHYVYYSRINPTRWAQFNDKYVEQFDLGKKDEEFEREMKAEMTPYILFYQKLG